MTSDKRKVVFPDPVLQLSEEDKKKWQELKVEPKYYHMLPVLLRNQTVLPDTKVGDRSWEHFDDDEKGDINEAVSDLLYNGTMAELLAFFEPQDATVKASRQRRVREHPLECLSDVEWLLEPLRPDMFTYLFDLEQRPFDYKTWGDIVDPFLAYCAYPVLGPHTPYLAFMCTYMVQRYNATHPEQPQKTEQDLWNSLFRQAPGHEFDFQAMDLANRCHRDGYYPGSEVLKWLYDKAGRPELYPREVVKFMIAELAQRLPARVGTLEILGNQTIVYNQQVYEPTWFQDTIAWVGIDAVRNALAQLTV